MKSHREITETIVHIENNFPVNDIKYRGYKIWPIIRISLAYSLLHSNKFQQVRKVNKGRNKTLRYFISAFFNYRRKKKTQTVLIKILKKKIPQNIENIYLQNEGEKLIDYRGNKINPFYYGLRTRMNPNKMFLFANDNSSENSIDISSIEKFSNEYKELNSIGRQTILRSLFPTIKNYGSFLKKMNEMNIVFDDHDIFCRKLDYILGFNMGFKKLVFKTKINNIFFITYFHDNNLAVSETCRELNLNAIEIQHGQQCEYSPFNNNFTVVPKTGYPFWPNIFWVFGQESKERKIASTIPAKHKIVVGGHPWLQLWVDDFEKMTTNSFSLPIDKNEKKNILFILQPVKNPFPEFWLDFMKKNESKFNFWIRLHPYMLNQKGDFNALLKNNGIFNFEIEASSNCLLYDVLNKVDIVLTLWSTVAFEALAFRCKVILCSINGLELMGKYVESGIMGFAQSCDELVEILSRDTIQNSVNFIETNSERIEKEIFFLK